MSHALQISPSSAGPALTPAQKKFNHLIGQIGRSRRALASWHEAIASFRRAHAGMLLPLHAELERARRDWVFALDLLLAESGWTKPERRTLRELVCDAAGSLLMTRGDDEALKELFARHSLTDFDTEQRERVLAMKDLTEAMTGLDLGDEEGLQTDADLFERVQQGMREQAAAQEAAQEAAREAADARRQARSARKPPNAARQRREAEAQQATQSVREIFRKLASALHPDREPDPAQRAAKTTLMQRVNQAYDAGDLLSLLELQLEIEQIDETHIAHAGAQRVMHYNKVLGEQLAELKAEIDRVEMDFRAEFGLEPGWGLTPRQLPALVEQEARALREDIAEVRAEMRLLKEPAATRLWIKRQRARLREDPFLPF